MPLLGFIGRLDFQKGPDVVLEAVGDLSARGLQACMNLSAGYIARNGCTLWVLEALCVQGTARIGAHWRLWIPCSSCGSRLVLDMLNRCMTWGILTVMVHMEIGTEDEGVLISRTHTMVLRKSCRGLLQTVMLGSGMEEYESEMRRLEGAHPQHFRGWVGFSIPVAHRIVAGAAAVVTQCPRGCTEQLAD